MILSAALALFLSGWQNDRNNQPFVSATDPAYLACSVWNGRQWTKPITRSARTPILVSPKGFRAYAEVTAAVHGASCGNTIKLYVSSGTYGEFKIVYRNGESENAGYGIRLVSWSPTGDKLLAQVNSWQYETDTGYGRLALIYDTATGSAREIKTLDKALWRHFGSNCEFEFAIQQWKTNSQLLVKVSKALEDESGEVNSCVAQPVRLVFDLDKGTVEPHSASATNR